MMEHTLRSALSKALLISLWAGVVHAHGPDDNQCALLAAEAGELLYDDQYAGITVTYVSSGWCNQNCSGWTLFPGSYMSLLVINFILPTVIFALVIARRWHLDLPAHLLDINSRHSRILLKLLCSFVAVGVVAFLDMVFWIAAIITLAGPMILSGLQEMLLDFKIVRALREIHHHAAFRGLTPGDRLDLLVSLLCGNFAGKSGQTMMQIRTTLSPTPQTAATLEHSKARLIAILAAQANFGFAVGIAALFFLGAFLYNALGINELTVKGINWTPYALWLMVMVIVALLSATLLTGNNPNVVNILLTAQHHPQSRKWYHIVVDYYQNELYPVSMWDRGDSKMNWVRNSQACRTHAWLAQKMDLGWKSWATLGLVAVLLTIFAPLMAYGMAYHLPFPREGCRSLSYVLYASLQVWLIGVALKRSKSGLLFEDFPVADSSTRFYQSWQLALRWIFYGICIAATAAALCLSFFIALFGSIFQIFGIYNNCFCQTSVSTWGSPASGRYTYLGFFAMSDDYAARLGRFATGMIWTAAGIVGGICYFGWWYQKVLKSAVMREIESL